MSDFCKKMSAYHAKAICNLNTNDQYLKETEEYVTTQLFSDMALFLYDISVTNTFNGKTIDEARQMLLEETMSDEDWKNVYKEIKQYYIENYEDGEKLYHEIYGDKEEEP